MTDFHTRESPEVRDRRTQILIMRAYDWPELPQMHNRAFANSGTKYSVL